MKKEKDYPQTLKEQKKWLREHCEKKGLIVKTREIEKVAIYLRLIDKDDITIEKYKNIALQYCANRDYDIYKIYIDNGYSGKNTNRPDFKDMMSEMKSGLFNRVLIYHIGQLTTNLKDYHYICKTLSEYQCELESIEPEHLDMILTRLKYRCQK